MFGKEVEGNVQEGRINSILGKGCKFKGTIEVEGTLRIDAEFEGVVNCPDTLVVGKTGVVKAEINVKNAVVGGKVIGNINATNKIELQSGSHIEGDIHTHRLVIDEGVFFEGSCKMGGTPVEGDAGRTQQVAGTQTGVGVTPVGTNKPPVRDKVGV
jgi:cytoskeletal protein CcmA (bactofilin family)